MIPWAQIISELASWQTLLALVAGTILGLLIGSMPGIGPVAGIALLLPLSFFLRPLTALLFYTTLYQAAEYGGSISAIAISVPGTANASAVIADGSAMREKGKPGKAFAYSLWATVISSIISIVIVVALAPVIAKYTVYIGAPEIMALGVLALSTTAVLTTDAPRKGLTAVALGVLAGTVGSDPISGVVRFTAHNPSLYDGLPLTPMLIGIFALPEAMSMIIGRRPGPSADGDEIEQRPRDTKVWLTRKELNEVRGPLTLGTGIGFVAGVIPGLVASVPSWVSYNVARATSKSREQFGHGAPAGIVAPEATNGAGMHTTLVPAFFLGIPGTPTSAVILGAMTIGGLVPGPLLVQQHADLLYGIFLGLLVGAVMLWFFGRLTTSFWVRLTGLQPTTLGVIVILLSTLGAFAGRNNIFDVELLAVSGALGLLMYRLDYSRAAFVVGFIISPIIESNLRRSLLISGDASFLASPVVIVILVASAAIVFWAVRGRRSQAGRATSRKISNSVPVDPGPDPAPGGAHVEESAQNEDQST